MQPILIISRHRGLADVAPDLLPGGDAPVVIESNWRDGLRLCEDLRMAMVVIDLALPHPDVFEIGRTFWRRTLTPILFIDSRTLVETAPPAQVPAVARERRTAPLKGWTTLTSDDIALSKRSSPNDDLPPRAQRRIG